MTTSMISVPRCRAGSRAWLLLALVVGSAGCEAPVRVVRETPRQVQRTLSASALNSNHPSEATRVVMTRRGLTRYWEEHPEEALAWLHAGRGVAERPERRPLRPRRALLPPGPAQRRSQRATAP
jgi:hypothetical protein